MMDAQRLKATFSLSFGADGSWPAAGAVDPALRPARDPATVFIAKARARYAPAMRWLQHSGRIRLALDVR
jgi:hypothetical protein